MRERWREEPTRAESWWPTTSVWPPARRRTGSAGSGADGDPVRALPVEAMRRRGRAPAVDPVDATRHAILDTLDRQLDLRRVELGDESLVAYENTAWMPVRAVATGAAAEASRQAGAEALIRSDFTGAAPALPGPLPTEGAGPVAGEVVLLAEASTRGGSSPWTARRCQADGVRLGHRVGPSVDLGVGTGERRRCATAPRATRYAIVAAQVLLGCWPSSSSGRGATGRPSAGGWPGDGSRAAPPRP